MKISGTLREELKTFYCSLRHETAINDLFSSEMISGCQDGGRGEAFSTAQEISAFYGRGGFFIVSVLVRARHWS